MAGLAWGTEYSAVHLAQPQRRSDIAGRPNSSRRFLPNELSFAGGTRTRNEQTAQAVTQTTTGMPAREELGGGGGGSGDGG
eukprot:CAMPEP_0119541666 /NCGR_PEP_ID=MMETSP1344-20130328/53102_1 /TAXON_ID=236787 /ORGANISM="Florenciella parvula, Strain CCMP2471" /LENGTH=80 /DNA_ID=CAMNT_0007585697 /DNA_START=144 /DNA_END=382 /DNA_ORIENTATION=-